MKKVLLLIPLHRTGGIASWGQKFYQTYQNSDIKLIAVDNAPNRSNKAGMLERIISGLVATKRILRSIREQSNKNTIDIIHTTTSGSIGSYRDILIGRFCKQRKIKSILHCHYGNISNVLESRGVIRFLTLKALSYYDQIWVLDRKSFDYLKNLNRINGDIKLIPNSIEVNDNLKITPKAFRNIAFIGNLIPDKGIFELVEAVKRVKHYVRLHIVGDGTPEVINNIKKIAGEDLNSKIILYGRLSNRKAVMFMKSIDILALPTYMRAEAFPISILEAMSIGKLVISTKRAAIQDMLTGLDGSPCGIFVREQNIDDIANAITWCIENTPKADLLCSKAYEKVYNSYRIEVVYNLYTACYQELLKA
ncbi:glycosyltransferase family 4 protein [uncultured Phocaeicola sp.]|uniref:glycosyltransferase family 4 protein n=1 Tax=uncultured Phocaeicola sp. TaxID=990718 RepID=UPI0025F404CD|nr:glycosyltransferase family 4 protein [uncultured Phocaeicola sp.]